MTAIELLEIIPLSKIESISNDVKADRYVKKLYGKDMFLLMLMSILDSERVSLRIMENLYKNKKFQLMANLKTDSKTCHTSLSDRLKTIKIELFEELFQSTYETLNKYCATTQIDKKLNRP